MTLVPDTAAPVSTQRHGRVHVITLRRASRGNAVDLHTARALAAMLDEIDEAAVGSLLIRSEGQTFCSGGDLAAMATAPDREALVYRLASELGAALATLRRLPVPVVGEVQGAVAGAGLALLLSCDVVVSAREATFRSAYQRVGLTPDCGTSFLLPRAVGQHRALDLLLTGRVLDAPTALAWGLVSEVVEAEELRSRGEQIAHALSLLPTFSAHHTKRLVRSSWDLPEEVLLGDEVGTVAAAAMTPEASQLVDAFAARSEVTLGNRRG